MESQSCSQPEDTVPLIQADENSVMHNNLQSALSEQERQTAKINALLQKLQSEGQLSHPADDEVGRFIIILLYLTH